MDLSVREMTAFKATMGALLDSREAMPHYIGEFRSVGDLPRNIEYPTFYCWDSPEGVVLSTNEDRLSRIAKRAALRGGVVLTSKSMGAVVSAIKEVVTQMVVESLSSH